MRGFAALMAAVAVALIPATSASGVDMPVSGKKLILKRTPSGKEKLVWISKDAAFLFPPLDSADDPAETVGAELAIFSEAEPAGATFTMMPAGLGKPGWKKRDGAVDLYKFVNPDAPAGLSEVKVLVMKDTKLIKVVAKEVGLALATAQGSVGIRLTTGSIRNCALFAPANALIKKDEADKFIAKDSTTAGVVDCGDAALGGGVSTTTTSSSTSTSVTATSTTTTTMPEWGLSCFPSFDCGSTFCPANGLQCTDFIENVGLVTGDEMCFFDCMDGTGFGSFMDAIACRDGCAGGPIPAPPCMSGTAGAGGFTGVVTGPGMCTPSGFGATVTFGGSASVLKRVLVDFGVAIDETALFGGSPPACSGSCPSPSSACDAGAPYAATPSPALFRLQIGSPIPAPEVCDRSGVPTTACKYSATGYAFIFDLPPGSVGGIDTTGAPIDVTLFMSCHIESSGGGTFLHFSTGDFFATGTF